MVIAKEEMLGDCIVRHGPQRPSAYHNLSEPNRVNDTAGAHSFRHSRRLAARIESA